MIDTDAKLVRLVSDLVDAEWIAVDTEADSLHSYPERLCLIQISVQGRDALIDPLAGVNLAPLWKLFERHELVLHGADYDLRLLRKGHKFKPAKVFDTMIAARLLGYEKFGLRDLVERHLGIRLEKGPQKMDWGRRPLTERMRRYALNDTTHLRVLELQLKRELAQMGRLEWAEECCRQLIEETSREKPSDAANAWRVKGSDRLTPRAAAMLRELWHWREAEALRANRPPYFILSHESLVDLAVRVSHKGPGAGLIPPRIVGRRRSTLEQAIQKALAIPDSDFPQPPQRSDVRLTGSEQARMAELRTVRDGRAKDLKLDPALIASRADLVALARNEKRGLSSLMPWQARLLGLV